jgi:hypothetical protein
MHGTHLPLRTWFLAAYLLATHSNGMSALQLQPKLGLGSYKTAWLLLHKLRRAMVDPDRRPLRGIIEIDETNVPFRRKDEPNGAPVGRVAVGDEKAADGGVVPDEGVQALAVDVDDTLQAASRRALSSLHLDGTDHENLADGTAPLAAAPSVSETGSRSCPPFIGEGEMRHYGTRYVVNTCTNGISHLKYPRELDQRQQFAVQNAPRTTPWNTAATAAHEDQILDMVRPERLDRAPRLPSRISPPFLLPPDFVEGIEDACAYRLEDHGRTPEIVCGWHFLRSRA